MPRWVFKFGIAGRSPTPNWASYIGQRPQIIDRREETVSLPELYNMARECNAVRKSIQALRDYIFINGYEWEPKWSKACEACGHKFPPNSKPTYCVKCDGTSLRPPDHSQVAKAEEFFRSVDLNGNTLIESLKAFEEHLDTSDSGFLVLRQDYGLDKDGRIVKVDKLTEMYVADPRSFKMVAEPVSFTPGGLYFVCIKHRPSRRIDRNGAYTRSEGQVYKMPGNCPTCNGPLYDVWYVGTEPGRGSNNPMEYYIGDVLTEDGRRIREVIHVKKFSHGYGYGYAPLISVWHMAKVLVAQERYLRTFYEEERTPRLAVFIPTRNPSSVQDAWKEAEDKNVAQGGHFIPKFTFDPADSHTGVQVHEFSKPPVEMQFLETRDEIYRRVGAAYDVAPVFHGNVDAVGLQVQGPTQWQVTTLGAKKGQWIYNEKVFPAILEALGIGDWKLKLKEPEDKDQAEQWQTKILEAQYAMMMQQLGFPPQGRDLEGHFEFPNEPEMNPMATMGGGAAPGMEGMAGQQPAPPPAGSGRAEPSSAPELSPEEVPKNGDGGPDGEPVLRGRKAPPRA